MWREKTARANRILENRAAEIEAGAVPPAEAKEQIDGVNGGLTLTQTRAPGHKTDEHGQELANLSLIKLEAAWYERRRTTVAQSQFLCLVGATLTRAVPLRCWR